MYFEFFTEYWYLFAMLMFIVFMLSMDPAKLGGGAKQVTPSQVPAMQTRQDAVILDINEKDKFRQGHISQSINIPFSSLKNSIGKIKKYREKPVIIACENGINSKKALATMKKNEFTDLYLLTGGLNAWRKENLPLEKS